MKMFLKKCLTYITNQPVCTGYGVSFDDNIVLSRSPQDTEPRRLKGVTYTLRDPDDVGSFELIGLVRKNDEPMYQIKHIPTGEIVNFPKKYFDLMFQLKHKEEKK